MIVAPAQPKRRRDEDSDDDDDIAYDSDESWMFDFTENEADNDFVCDKLVAAKGSIDTDAYGEATNYDSFKVFHWTGTSFRLKKCAMKPYSQRVGAVKQDAIPREWVVRQFLTENSIHSDIEFIDVVPKEMSHIRSEVLYERLLGFVGRGDPFPKGKSVEQLWNDGYPPWKLVRAFLRD